MSAAQPRASFVYVCACTPAVSAGTSLNDAAELRRAKSIDAVGVRPRDP